MSPKNVPKSSEFHLVLPVEGSLLPGAICRSINEFMSLKTSSHGDAVVHC